MHGVRLICFVVVFTQQVEFYKKTQIDLQARQLHYDHLNCAPYSFAQHTPGLPDHSSPIRILIRPGL